jgi:hypothetical protein
MCQLSKGIVWHGCGCLIIACQRYYGNTEATTENQYSSNNQFLFYLILPISYVFLLPASIDTIDNPTTYTFCSINRYLK